MSTRKIVHLLVVTLVAAVLPLAASGTADAAKPKKISIKDASIVEGDGGMKSLTFSVTWTGSKGGGAVSASYSTAAVSATADGDYTATTGTVSLSNGSCRCGAISVPILGDNLAESTETFQVNLSNPVNATIADGQAIGTIYDNEGPLSVIVTDASADEAAGTMSFGVQLTSGSAGTVTLDYATTDGIAVAGSDYTPTTGSLTFATGQTLKTVSVPVTSDGLDEDDETFKLDVSNVIGAAVTASQGMGTIADDDAEPDISIADASVYEGDTGDATLSFAVSLSVASGREVAVDYATTDGTALHGSDYASEFGSLTFGAGEISQNVDISVKGDLMFEGDETFTISLSSPSNANAGDADAVGTIVDVDPMPSVSISDVTVVEGSLGTATATFSVAMDTPSAFDASVDWASSDGTAVAGTDYEANGGTVTFLPGEISHSVVVTVIGDTLDEPDESFTVSLSDASDASITDASGTGTINDDDKTPTALTLSVKKTARTVRAAGLLEPAASGMKVHVTLFKRNGTRYRKVLAKTVMVASLGDRDSDGQADSTFAATFRRTRHGQYKLIARYGGSTQYLASVRKVKFKL